MRMLLMQPFSLNIASSDCASPRLVCFSAELCFFGGLFLHGKLGSEYKCVCENGGGSLRGGCMASCFAVSPFCCYLCLAVYMFGVALQGKTGMMHKERVTNRSVYVLLFH